MYRFFYLFLRNSPVAFSLQPLTARKTERSWKRGWKMKMRTAGKVPKIGLAALPFAIALLACGAATASDVERQIPLTRDSAGSGLTIEISREGTRQTATPFLTLNNPTVRRIEERIAKKTDRLGSKELPPREPVACPIPGIGPTETPRDDSGRPEPSLSSLPPVPEEITARSVKSFLKRLRASWKKTPVPAAVVAAPPEQRLERTGTPPHEAN